MILNLVGVISGWGIVRIVKSSWGVGVVLFDQNVPTIQKSKIVLISLVSILLLGSHSGCLRDGFDPVLVKLLNTKIKPAIEF